MADTSLQRRATAPVTTGQDAEHAAAHPAVRYNPDAPSEEWGWHGSWRVFAPKGSALILWIGVFVLVMFNFTEHESRVENYYFNGLALIGAAWLLIRARQSRKMKHRQRERDETHAAH